MATEPPVIDALAMNGNGDAFNDGDKIENETKTIPMETAETVEDNYVMPENAVDISRLKDGGVMKVILKEGTGDDHPGQGDKVYVHYVGTLTNGDKFDSSRDRDDHFSFTLGKSEVIKAWDIGVATMKKGEVCKLICKSDYAYGDTGSGAKIPPKATLIFEIELFRWHGEDISKARDNGIIRTVKKKGELGTSPKPGASVSIHIKGSYEGRVFEDRDVDFCQGEGSDVGVIDGVDEALLRFKIKETSLLKISSKYAFGHEGNKEFSIPADADVEYEVTLNSFEKVKEAWEMGKEEKLEQAEIVKEKGTKHFKNGKYKLAAIQYKRIVDFLQHETEYSPEDKVKRDNLMLAAHLNLAMCALKSDESLEVIEQCNKALELQPRNEKGLFRRGSARLNLQDYDEAIVDFKVCLEIDANNKAAKHQIAIAQHKIKLIHEQEKKVYGGMFQKFAEIDAKNNKSDEKASDKKVDEWNNDMAKGMMPLDEEKAAFDEDVTVDSVSDETVYSPPESLNEVSPDK